MLALFLLIFATTIVFFILVGYPILLASFFRRSAPPVRKDMHFRTTVSVLIAVKNGEQFIQQKLESLLALNYPAELVEIVVVSDGSTDRTDAIAESYAGRGVRLLRAPSCGKAAALNRGLGAVSGDLLFLTDVRQAIHSESLPQMVANFADPTVGAVTGELRFLNPKRAGSEADMEVYWRYERWARRRHAEIDSACQATGCIYAIRRSLVAPIPNDTLSDDVVIPLRALFKGYRIIVEPKAVALDYPAIRGEFRRKMRTLAGLWQVHVRLPELYTRVNRMRFHFLAHKTSRLALPWTILLAVAATAALPWPAARNFLLCDELLLFALALIDHVIPETSPVTRISSPARSFLSMNAASFLSILVFLVPAGRFWTPSQVTLDPRNR